MTSRSLAALAANAFQVLTAGGKVRSDIAFATVTAI